MGGVGKTPPESIYNNASSDDSDINLCIDYISCSFDFYQHSNRFAKFNAPLSREKNEYDTGLEKLYKLFKILTYPDEKEREYKETGIIHYRDGVWCLGESIKVFLTGPLNKYGVRTNFLDMSGEGCREFEKRGGNYAELLRFLTLENAQFTRNDAAIDVFTNRYFDIAKLLRYVKKGWYTSPMGKGRFIWAWSEHGLLTAGDSLYFGTKNSNTLINIYDKKLERFSKGIETFTPAWIRVEIRFKHERANWFAQNFLNHIENDNDFSFIQEALFRNLKFKVPVIINSKGKKIKTKNLLRKFWCNAKWWDDFIAVTKEAKFNAKDIKELSIERNKKHIKRSDSKILARLFFTDADTFFHDIMQLVFLGHEKLDTVDFVAINKYRKKNNMTELKKSDIEDLRLKLEKMMKGLGISSDE